MFQLTFYKMKKTNPVLLTLYIGVFMLVAFLVEAQKKDSPDHTNYYKSVSKETPELNIEIVDAVSRMEYAKFKIKLTNNTSDYIVYKPKESSFTIADKDFPLSDRILLLSPLEKGSRVLDIKGNGTNVHVDQFSFNMKGLGKINANAPTTEAPNFKLPASVNDISAGHFKIEMIKLDKETDETKVKFKVTYLGDDYGLVDPTKLAVKTEKTGETEYANTKNKQDAFLLAKGESENFIASFKIPGKVVDMQFANMEIVWRNTFKDSKLTPLENQLIELIIDEGLTAGKNK